MSMKAIAAGLIGVTLAAPTLAQPTSRPEQPKMVQLEDQLEQQIGGWPVYSLDRQQIGTVAGFEDGKLRVELDEATGTGTKTVEVDETRFAPGLGEDRINLTLNAEEVKRLPAISAQ